MHVRAPVYYRQARRAAYYERRRHPPYKLTHVTSLRVLLVPYVLFSAALSVCACVPGQTKTAPEAYPFRVVYCYVNLLCPECRDVRA